MAPWNISMGAIRGGILHLKRPLERSGCAPTQSMGGIRKRKKHESDQDVLCFPWLHKIMTDCLNPDLTSHKNIDL